ncbi:MAG TPA: hypothetical protein VIM85_02725 [Pseudomonadales bacterium]
MAENTQSKTMLKVIIAVLVLFNGQAFAEVPKDLDVEALSKFKTVVNDSAVLISIDKKGNRTLLDHNLEKGERCVINSNNSLDMLRQCTAFNKSSELLTIENSTLMISKGSYIFTYFINGVAHQICYDDNWNRITCP